MKIIKYGSKVVKKLIICEDCDTTLEFTKTDLKLHPRIKTVEHKYISCPVCGHGIIIPDDTVRELLGK